MENRRGIGVGNYGKTGQLFPKSSYDKATNTVLCLLVLKMRPKPMLSKP